MHFVGLLLTLMLVYSFPHHLYQCHLSSLVFTVTRGVSKRSIQANHLFLSHALLLLYLICKEHLFFTFLFSFCSFLYFPFSFICLMPTSLHFSCCPIMVCLLMPHFSLLFHKVCLSFLLITCWFCSFIILVLSLSFSCLQLLFFICFIHKHTFYNK